MDRSDRAGAPGHSEDRMAARHYAETAARVQELESQLAEAEARRAELDARLSEPNPELEELRAKLKRIESSIIWQGVHALRRRVYGRIGDDSRAARMISSGLRGAARIASMKGSLDAPPPVASPQPAVGPASVTPPAIAEVPYFAAPEVSLILPVYSQPELTAACVRSIVATATVPYELILVDDKATAAVKDVVRRIAGATVMLNDENVGYTRSLNRGAARARGEFFVFLNDDTSPQPGWLEAMIDCARSSSDIGVVVPMYLDQDGRLKEAGSIIWSDGSAENFGRGDADPDRSRYAYRRDVDYGSGACLLVRADLFREISGLDERFSPAYYEDVDLCFAVREAGARVVYEPRARVVHVEGATAGTDETAGTKRFQAINHRPFVEKWRHRLDQQPHRGGDPRFASRRSDGPQVLIADEKVPTPDRDGGSHRMWRLIEAFRGLGCGVTFLPASGEASEPYATRLEAEGVEVLRRPTDVGPEIAAISPGLALAVLSRPHVASRYVYMLRESAPAARIAYDTVDLHYLRELQRSFVEISPAGPRIAALRELELAMVRCCDVTIVVTDEEREEILRAVPDAAVETIPTIQEPISGVPPLDGRSGIVFVGSFEHLPNVDAASFLVRDVMPHVWRQQADVQLIIVGQHPPAEVQALAGPRVEVTGWLDDIAAVLGRARVAVAPMRYGAGLTMKTVGAMAHGVPVVSTTLVAEGMGATSGAQLLVADEPHELAAAISALLHDDHLWHRMSDAGRALVQERYEPGAITQRIRALLPG